MLRFPAWENFHLSRVSKLPPGPTHPAIREAPTAIHRGKAAGSLSRPHIYTVMRLIMSEATSSPAHTLHGVYKDNFNLHSIRQAAIGVGSSVHAQLSMLPVAAPRLCYSRYCSSPITFIVLTIIAPHSRYTKINETPLYQQQMSEGGGGTAVAIVWVSVVLRMFRVYI